MTQGHVVTVDTLYDGQPEVAAAYLLHDGAEAAFVETNTSFAVPRLLAALADAGLPPQAVRYVVITHIHLDHAGGAGVLMDALPDATLLAHPRAAPHAIDPARIVAGATAVYGEERFAALYGEIRPIPEARVRAMADGERVPFGGDALGFLHTRGHANHHACVTWHDAVFTGDAFGIAYPALQRNGRFCFPSTSPTDFDAEQAHLAVDRVVGCGARRAFLTHHGLREDLAEMASELHRLLDAHQALVERAEAGGLPDQALDLFFRAGVAELFERELVAHGLAGDADARALLALDIELNAQGLAAAVRRLRRKRG